MLFIIVIAGLILLMYIAVKRQATKVGSAILLLGPGFLSSLLSGIYLALKLNDPSMILNVLVNPLEFYDRELVFGNFWLGFVGTLYWIVIFAGAWYLAFSMFFVNPKEDRKKVLPISLLLGVLSVYALGGLKYTVTVFSQLIVISLVIATMIIVDYLALRWWRHARRKHLDTSIRDNNVRAGSSRRTIRIRPLQILPRLKESGVREEGAGGES